MNTKRNLNWAVRVGLAAGCALAFALFLVTWVKKTHAQSQPHVPVHITTDWSNRHMIYSAPSTVSKSLQLQAEPRYTQQLARRAARATQAQSGQ